MAGLSNKAKGMRAFNAEVRTIMDKHNCNRKEALEIRKSGQNGASPSHNGKGAEAEYAALDAERAAFTAKLTVQGIARATEARIEFLTATISGIRQQLEAYQEELGQLVGVTKALGIELSEQAEQAVGVVV